MLVVVSLPWFITPYHLITLATLEAIAARPSIKRSRKK